MRWSPELLTEITNKLADQLEPKRFLHTLGVVQTATVLAQLHSLNAWRGVLAALLHDCAKHTGSEEYAQCYSTQFGSHPYLQDGMPQLWHAPAGAWRAYREFGVDDPEVIEAIAWHPTGKPDPSPTLLLLLAADYCEPTRDFPGVEEIRSLVRKDLVAGVRALLRSKIAYVEMTGRKLHWATKEAVMSLETRHSAL
ncbi:MAG: bis(5'-nucleosyl)-tetraphosphatase (symmetrical) YqeK [Candidatus Sumerlaeaceae bacterium]|jgi:predicted HD superfamily hydrolase involved in NAD metabolism